MRGLSSVTILARIFETCCGCVELSGFLARTRCKLTDQVFIGIPQYIGVGFCQAEIDLIQMSQYFGN